MNAKQFFLFAALATTVACHTNAECPKECTENTECSQKNTCCPCPEECSKNNDCSECPEECLKSINGIELSFKIKRAESCDEETWRKIINSVIDCAKDYADKDQDEFDIASFINIIDTAMAAEDGSIYGQAQIKVCSEDETVTTVEE